MSFDPTTGNVNIPYANVPDAAASSNEVLIINNTGLIQKKDLSLTSVTALNDLQGSVKLTVSADDALSAARYTNTTGKELDLQLPIMAGGATQTYGLMSIEDWKKLQTITSATGITIGDIVQAGADGATIERLTGADEGKLVLHLVEASATDPGIVTIGAQTFAGDKTFGGAVVVSGATTLENTTEILGDATMSGTATFKELSTFEKNVAITGNTTIGGTAAVTGNASFTNNVTIGKDLVFTTPKAFSTTAPTEYKMAVVNDAAGKTLEFVNIPAHTLGGISALKVGSDNVKAGATDGIVNLVAGKTGSGFTIVGNPAGNTVTINVPDASATAEGIVTILPQTFNGEKTFDDTVNIGTSTDKGSRFNVNTAMSLPFQVLPAGDYTMGDTDYMVLASCSSSGTGAIGETVPKNFINLPAANTCKNRVYVIRRVMRVTDEIAELHIKASTGKISGHDQIIIAEPGFTVTVASNGTNWYLVSRSIM